MRLLITGGGSYLGQQLVPLALAAQEEATYTYFSNDPLNLDVGYQLDVRDKTAVAHLISTLNPQTIIHTVGSNRGADMQQVIQTGTTNITQAAKSVGARLIHLSTDVVFGGDKAPYAEDDPPQPLHDYGRAKAAAEKTVSHYPNHVIIRTSLIYGLKLMDRGTEWITKALTADEPVTLFTNQQRNPVWAETLSLACLELANNEYRGILHVAGSQEMSRADFALRLLDWWGVTNRDMISLGEGDPDRWPADCTFDLRKATAVLDTPLLGVDAVLERNGTNDSVDGRTPKQL